MQASDRSTIDMAVHVIPPANGQLLCVSGTKRCQEDSILFSPLCEIIVRHIRILGSIAIRVFTGTVVVDTLIVVLRSVINASARRWVLFLQALGMGSLKLALHDLGEFVCLDGWRIQLASGVAPTIDVLPSPVDTLLASTDRHPCQCVGRNVSKVRGSKVRGSKVRGSKVQGERVNISEKT